jgi:pimeloyl-ACP methyl ester carboxylesterase
MNREIDVRHVLPSIQVPTLIVHGTGDTGCTDRRGALHADRIGGARLVEISGGRQSMAGAEFDRGLDEVE